MIGVQRIATISRRAGDRAVLAVGPDLHDRSLFPVLARPEGAGIVDPVLLIDSAAPRLRRGAQGLERRDRPPPGADRALRRRGRRRRRAAPRARARAGGRRARRRPRRRRPRGQRRRPGDRPLADEGHRGRPRAAHRPRRGRRAVGRARRGHAGARPGDRRRHRHPHRHRRPHARRRHRLADAPARRDGRQPARRRRSSRPTARSSTPTRTSCGACAAAAATSASSPSSSSACTRSARPCSPARSTTRSRTAPRCCATTATSSPTAPDELTTILNLRQAPPLPVLPPELHGRPVVTIAACWAGDPDEGEAALAPLRAHGRPLADLIAPRPYVELQAHVRPRRPARLALLLEVLGGPAAHRRDDRHAGRADRAASPRRARTRSSSSSAGRWRASASTTPRSASAPRGTT